MLHRLEAAGLVTSRDVVVDGHRRRTYAATTRGEKAFHRCQRALRELSDEVLGS
jgi:DNA-binding PadR family transcriptional regulator